RDHFALEHLVLQFGSRLFVFDRQRQVLDHRRTATPRLTRRAATRLMSSPVNRQHVDPLVVFGILRFAVDPVVLSKSSHDSSPRYSKGALKLTCDWETVSSALRVRVSSSDRQV